MSQMDMRLYNAAMEKLANLGGLQAAYVADAAGADASERASQLAGDRAREDEESGLIDDLFGQGGDANRMINKRKRHANAAFAENDGARLLNVVDPSKLLTESPDQTLTGLAMLSGKKNKDRESRVLDQYKDIIKKYQDPVEMDGEKTTRETPYHLMMQGQQADKDTDVAGHKQQRKEKPLNYWLNPLDRTGPLHELGDRLQRRIGASVAQPDSALGRFGMGAGNVGTLGLLGALAGGEDAQNKLRRSAVDNEIFGEHSMPEGADKSDKPKDGDGDGKVNDGTDEEKKAGMIGGLLGGGAMLMPVLTNRKSIEVGGGEINPYRLGATTGVTALAGSQIEELIRKAYRRNSKRREEEEKQGGAIGGVLGGLGGVALANWQGRQIEKEFPNKMKSWEKPVAMGIAGPTLGLAGSEIEDLIRSLIPESKKEEEKEASAASGGLIGGALGFGGNLAMQLAKYHIDKKKHLDYVKDVPVNIFGKDLFNIPLNAKATQAYPEFKPNMGMAAGFGGAGAGLGGLAGLISSRKQKTQDEEKENEMEDLRAQVAALSKKGSLKPGTEEFNNALHNHMYGKDMPKKKKKEKEKKVKKAALEIATKVAAYRRIQEKQARAVRIKLATHVVRMDGLRRELDKYDPYQLSKSAAVGARKPDRMKAAALVRQIELEKQAFLGGLVGGLGRGLVQGGIKGIGGAVGGGLRAGAKAGIKGAYQGAKAGAKAGFGVDKAVGKTVGKGLIGGVKGATRMGYAPVRMAGRAAQGAAKGMMGGQGARAGAAQGLAQGFKADPLAATGAMALGGVGTGMMAQQGYDNHLKQPMQQMAQLPQQGMDAMNQYSNLMQHQLRGTNPQMPFQGMAPSQNQNGGANAYPDRPQPQGF